MSTEPILQLWDYLSGLDIFILSLVVTPLVGIAWRLCREHELRADHSEEHRTDERTSPNWWDTSAPKRKTASSKLYSLLLSKPRHSSRHSSRECDPQRMRRTRRTRVQKGKQRVGWGRTLFFCFASASKIEWRDHSAELIACNKFLRFCSFHLPRSISFASALDTLPAPLGSGVQELVRYSVGSDT